jgi:hypothetical protein
MGTEKRQRLFVSQQHNDSAPVVSTVDANSRTTAGGDDFYLYPLLWYGVAI